MLIARKVTIRPTRAVGRIAFNGHVVGIRRYNHIALGGSAVCKDRNLGSRTGVDNHVRNAAVTGVGSEIDVRDFS